MTRDELILAIVVCVPLGLATGLFILWTDLSQGGVIAVVGVVAGLAGLVGGQVGLRVDRRKHDQVH
jgi:hypothetical protein